MDWFAGASITSWYHQHTLGHHVYTNVMGIDPDLPATRSGDIRRVCKQQQWAWPYAFQHVYLCVLYGLLAIKFRIQDVTGTLWSRENGAIRVNDNQGLTEPIGQMAHQAVLAQLAVHTATVLLSTAIDRSVPTVVTAGRAGDRLLSDVQLPSVTCVTTGRLPHLRQPATVHVRVGLRLSFSLRSTMHTTTP